MDLFDFLITRWYFSLPLLTTLIFWWFYESNKGGKKIGPSEAVTLVNSGEAIFLDIRDKNSFETGHIHGSINIPKDSSNNKNIFLQQGK